MRDRATQTVLQMKYARIIEEIAKILDTSLEEAMDVFYNSDMMPLIDQGIADLHCRSDRYLAGEIIADLRETGWQQNPRQPASALAQSEVGADSARPHAAG